MTSVTTWRIRFEEHETFASPQSHVSFQDFKQSLLTTFGISVEAADSYFFFVYPNQEFLTAKGK